MAWIANLSNGKILKEGKAIAGESSPWQALLKHCRDDDLTITGLRLKAGDITIVSMPAKACDGYFHAYETIRVLWRDRTVHRQGIGSVVGDNVYITWVDLAPDRHNMRHIYQEIRKLNTVKVHTTID